VPALAAVVAMAILGWWGMSPRGSWVVTAGVPQGTVRVEGGSGAYGAVVSPGQVAVLDTVEFELQLAHDVRIRLVPGTVAELPKPPRRFFPPDPVLAVTHGEVYGTTSGPLPYRFILETPEARAVLTGTTFAVIRSETATCFCLFEGTLAVTDRIQGGERTLEPGNRLFVYRDGRPALSEPIDEAERAKLTMMSTQAIMETLPEPPDRGPR
jgi:ferric-dicitrate binding protein FerR (iron transport regulator)